MFLHNNPSSSKLPFFTLWKNTASVSEGFVTGLEPGTAFPNPKPFEREKGRVVNLQPGEMMKTSLSLEFLLDKDQISKVEEEITRLQLYKPIVSEELKPDFCPCLKA